jgi:hypothetical protein
VVFAGYLPLLADGHHDAPFRVRAMPCLRNRQIVSSSSLLNADRMRIVAQRDHPLHSVADNPGGGI